jgi:hypothetical protein
MFLHRCTGTVMRLSAEPIHSLQDGELLLPRTAWPYSGARNAKLSVDQLLFEQDASLGAGASHLPDILEI